MVISPECYMEEFRNCSLQKLYRERDKIIQAIKRFENKKINKEECETFPFPDTIYKFNREEYLLRLEILIAKREQNNFVSFKVDDYTEF